MIESNEKQYFKPQQQYETAQQYVAKQYPYASYKIDKDFIGVFDDLFDEDFCNSWINWYSVCSQQGMAHHRKEMCNDEEIVRSDEAIDLVKEHFTLSDPDYFLTFKSQEFTKKFWDFAYRLYSEKYSILRNCGPHRIYETKLQKTVPGQGYHVWHTETMGRDTCLRVMTFILYLNDINQGGETEFLYLNKRIKPKMGRLVLWPAGFTHTHRGNPPLKKSKYVVTGWVEW